MARAYILLNSTFTDQNGAKSAKNDVVWSDLPLIKHFPGKFRRATQSEIQQGRASPPEVVDEDADTGDDSGFFSGPPQTPQKPVVDLQEKSPAKPPGAETGDEEDGGGEDGNPDTGEAPKDVTDDYPKAEKHGLKVLRDSNGYSVLDDEGVEAHEPFKTERGLNNFLSEYGKKK